MIHNRRVSGRSNWISLDWQPASKKPCDAEIIDSFVGEASVDSIEKASRLRERIELDQY